MQSKESGFTFVEIAVVAPAIILMIGAFLVIVVTLTGEVLSTRAKNVLASDVQQTLTTIENDIRASDAFLATNSFAITSPQGSDDGSTAFVNADSDEGNALILDQSATVGNPLTPPISYVYIENQPNACDSPFLQSNTPVNINVVYFIKDDSLWRRVIMPSNYETVSCVTPWQQPSCSPGFSAAFCKTEDSELVKGVGTEGFTLTYYDSADSTIVNPTASDPDSPTPTRSAELESISAVSVSINASQIAAGKEVSWSASRRMVLP